MIALSTSLLLISGCAYPKIGTVPFINSLNPVSATAGGGAFTLTVSGAGFDASSAVQWNGSPRQTSFQSAAAVNAQISATDIAQSGTATVRVLNAGPGGSLLSNAVDFPIQ